MHGQVRPGSAHQVDLPLRQALGEHLTPPRRVVRRRRRHDQAHGLPARGVVEVNTYKVRAKGWTRGWELHIEGIGVTQSHSLGEAESMVRDYIALDLDVAPD